MAAVFDHFMPYPDVGECHEITIHTLTGLALDIARRFDMLAFGWECLADDPDRCFIAGATCLPWRADVVFLPISPERFAAYVEPDRVKIAWTLEA